MKNFAMLVLLLAIGIAGCRKQQTFVSPDGTSVTVNESGKDTTFRDAQGNTATLATRVSEAELGVPFYPGSSATEADSSFTADGKTSSISIRTTADAPGKVIEFYKGELDKVESDTNAGIASVLVGKKGDRDVSVMVSVEQGKTTIMVTAYTK